MAITKIWYIQKSQDGDLSGSLKRSLQYIVNPVKTDHGLLVGGVNCPADAMLAYQQMCETKQYFGKELGRQGYHVILSLDKGEGNPQTMYELTEEFIQAFLGDSYEAVFAVHTDKEHLHSHIIFNSCNMFDGYKYQYKKGDWKAIMQPITNQLCEKYGLSVIPAEYVHSDERRSRQEHEYQSSLKEVILADAEYCMANAEYVDEFIWNLRQLGYEVKEGKHIAVKAEGMKTFRRLDTWDESYSPECITETLKNLRGKDVTVAPLSDEVDCFSDIALPDMDYTYAGIYYYKMEKLKDIENNRFRDKGARFYKQLKELHKTHAEYLYLSSKNVNSAFDLIKIKEDVESKLETFGKEQKAIYASNRKLRNAMSKTPEKSYEYKLKLTDNEKRLAQIKTDKSLLYQERKMVETILMENKDGILTAISKALEERNQVKDSYDEKRPAIPESPWKKEKREKHKRLEQEAKRQEEERLARLKYEQEQRLREEQRQEELRRQQELQRQEELRRQQELQRQEELRKQQELQRQQELRKSQPTTQAAPDVKTADTIAVYIKACGGYQKMSVQEKAKAFGFDVNDSQGNIQLYSEVLRKLGIHKDQMEMFEDYQAICDATPKSSVRDELSEERNYRRGR